MIDPYETTQLTAAKMSYRTVKKKRLTLGHFKWVPCNHGTSCPQVVDGGEILKICRVHASTLNQQSQKADKGWLAGGLRTPHSKNQHVMKCYTNTWDLNGFTGMT
jgi:hypothetical protein